MAAPTVDTQQVLIAAPTASGDMNIALAFGAGANQISVAAGQQYDPSTGNAIRLRTDLNDSAVMGYGMVNNADMEQTSVDLIADPKRLVFFHGFSDQGLAIRDMFDIADNGSMAFGVRSGTDLTTNYHTWVFNAADSFPTSRSANGGAFCFRADYTDSVQSRSDGSDGTVDATDIQAVLMGATFASTQNRVCWLTRVYYTDGFVLTDGEVADPGTIVDFFDASQAANGNDDASVNLVSRSSPNQYLSRIALEIGDGTTTTYFEDANRALEFAAAVSDATVTPTRVLHAPENLVGLELNLTSSDTVILDTYLIASQTPFHLRFGSSVGADVQVRSCVINNAGGTDDDIEFGSDVTVTAGQLANCGKVDSNGATFNGTSFTNPANVTLIEADSATSLDNCSFSTQTATDHAIEIAAAGTYNFTGHSYTGFTTDIDVTATTGTATINISNGPTPTFTTAGATVVLNAGVPMEITVTDQDTGLPVENARVLLKNSATDAVLLTGLTNASGVLSGTYSGPSPLPVTGWVRKATPPDKLYKQFDLGGSITASGYSAAPLMQED